MNVLENNSVGSMKDNAKVSIVVPIYNVERYLSRCLDSIIGQTYKNIEIILIDDGSPDNAGAICDEYAAKDNRIVVHHIPNGGVAKARQLGVESSTSEYIVFVDPDDWLPSDSVENLLSYMNDDVDLVIGSYMRYREGVPFANPYVSQYLDGPEYTAVALSLDIIGVPWGRIFRRSLFGSDCFPAFPRMQDWLMNINIAVKCNRVFITSENVYNYTVDSSSSTLRIKVLTFEYYIEIFTYIKNKFCSVNMYERNKPAFSTAILYFTYPLVRDDIFIDRKEPIIKDMINTLGEQSLTLRKRMEYLCVKYPFFAWMIRSLNSIRRNVNTANNK